MKDLLYIRDYFTGVRRGIQYLLEGVNESIKNTELPTSFIQELQIQKVKYETEIAAYENVIVKINLAIK